MEEFKGKTIIVTGGSSGIGKATAELFALSNANVCIADINESEGNNLVKKLIHKNPNVIFYKTNVVIPEDLNNLVSFVLTKFKKIDILFNCAGFEGWVKEIKDTSIEEWDKIFDLHLKACFMLTKLTIPHMIKNNGGVIINIGSEVGVSFRFAPRYVPYCTSKAAVMAFTKALAIELAPYKIRVNCVAPGSINTPMVEREVEKWVTQGLYKTKEEAREVIYKSYPIGFIGEPIDIANAVAYLASDRARFVTGAVLSVDGGGGII